MNTLQVLIIIAFSGFSAWLIAWLLTRCIFLPVKPFMLGPLRIQGIIPANQEKLAHTISELVADEFKRYSNPTGLFATPEALATLKPEIEKHVDLFLQEKLPVVFPLLSKFMGEKTLNQFRQAFLAEIDLLLPVLINRYAVELQHNLALYPIIYEKLMNISLSEAGKSFYNATKSKLLRLRLISAFTGVMLGIVEIILLKLLH